MSDEQKQEVKRVCWWYNCHQTEHLYDLTPARWPDGRAAYACQEHYSLVAGELEDDGNDLDLGMIEGYLY